MLKSNVHFVSKILGVNSVQKWVALSSFMNKIEDLDADSCEVAKVELAKQFGVIVQLVPDKNRDKFINIVKQKYLKLGPTTSVKTRETTLS